MAKNRLIYLAALAGAAAFYFVSSVWSSWILLLAVVCLPAVSLLVSLPGALATRAELTVPESATLGQSVPVRLTVSVPDWAPTFGGRARLCAQTVWDEIKNKRVRPFREGVLEIAVTAEHCGPVTVRAEKIRFFDALGLLPVPVRACAPARCVVLPAAEEPEHFPDLDRLTPLRLVPAPGAALAEEYDIRSYNPGDNARMIHWKLSGKTGKLMVRESVRPVHRTLALTVSADKKGKSLDTLLGDLMAVSETLAQREQAHTVVWMERGKLRSSAVRSASDVAAALYGACAALPWSGPVEEARMNKSDLLYTFGSDGEEGAQ